MAEYVVVVVVILVGVATVVWARTRWVSLSLYPRRWKPELVLPKVWVPTPMELPGSRVQRVSPQG
jgi:hypothetical protein